MEYGIKIRVIKEEYRKNPINPDFVFSHLVHRVIDEIPTDVLKKMFKLVVIDPDDTILQLRASSGTMTKLEKIIFDELVKEKSIELKVTIKLNTK